MATVERLTRRELLARRKKQRKANTRAVAKLRDERVAAGLCINDARALGKPPHGPPVIKRDGKPAKKCRECTDANTKHKAQQRADAKRELELELEQRQQQQPEAHAA